MVRACAPNSVVDFHAGVVVGCVFCFNRLPGDMSAGRDEDGFVGLFPSRRGGLYQIASGFEDAKVNRLARIVLQLTFATLLLGLLFKALVVALFAAFVKPKHAVGPVVDLVFNVVFSAAAAWLGRRGSTGAGGVVAAPSIGVVGEAIGGIGPARDAVEETGQHRRRGG